MTLVFGVVLGVAAAALGSRLLADRLYGVSATDPSTIAAGAALLALVALAAAALPARQAARLAPVKALHRQ